MDTTDTTETNGANGAACHAVESPKAKESILAKIKRTSSRKVEKDDRYGLNVRKPHSGSEWFRSDPTKEIAVYLVDPKDGKGLRVVTEDVADFLGSRAKPGVLRACVNMDGREFLVPLRVSDDGYSTSLAKAIVASETEWVQTETNQLEGRYDWAVAKEEIGEPRWSKRSFEELVDASLSDVIVDSVDDPFVQRLKYGRVG